MPAPLESDDYTHAGRSGPTLAERFPTLHVPVTAEYGPEDAEQVRFSLRDLFLVTTAAAVMLALLRYMGIFGAVVSFLSAFLFTVVALPWLIPWQTARQCKVFDFVWGVVMPVVCLVFLTLAALVHRIEEFLIAGPLLTLYSVAMLTALVAGKSARRIAPFLAGLLAGGLIFWLLLMIVLALPAIFFTSYYGAGLLGFSPAFASIAFQRRMRLMMHLSQEVPGRFWLLVTGLLLSIVVPLAVGAVLTFWFAAQPAM